MQQRSDAKMNNPGQCERAARSSCRQSRTTRPRRSCRRQGKQAQQPKVAAVSETPSTAEPHCNAKGHRCDSTEVDYESDATTEVPDERYENVDLEPSTEADKEVDLEASAEDGHETVSVTDLNTTDAAQEQFVRQVVSSMQIKKASGKSPTSSFQSVSIPKVSLSSYASRIYKYFRCTDECFVLCLVYIDRIARAHPEIEVTDFSCHRLFFISAVVAAKFHDDTYASNEYFARVGGIQTTELNALEAEFLQLLDWKLYVGPSEYDLYVQTLRGQSLR